MFLKFDFKQLLKFGDRLSKTRNVRRVLRDALLAALYDAQSFVAKEHLSAPGRGRAGNTGPWIPNPYEDKLRTLTGYLRARFMAEKPYTVSKGSRIIGYLGVSNVVYAARHEFSVVGNLSKPRAPIQSGIKNRENVMKDILLAKVVESWNKQL